MIFPLPSALAADPEACVHTRARELFAERFDLALWPHLSDGLRGRWLALAGRSIQSCSPPPKGSDRAGGPSNGCSAPEGVNIGGGGASALIDPMKGGNGAPVSSEAA